MAVQLAERVRRVKDDIRAVAWMVLKPIWYVLCVAGVIHLVLTQQWEKIAWAVFFGVVLGVGWAWHDDYRRVNEHED